MRIIAIYSCVDERRPTRNIFARPQLELNLLTENGLKNKWNISICGPETNLGWTILLYIMRSFQHSEIEVDLLLKHNLIDNNFVWNKAQKGVLCTKQIIICQIIGKLILFSDKRRRLMPVHYFSQDETEA